jgi:hypothetical protein
VAGSLVLKPYERRREVTGFGKFMLFAGIIFVAAFYGLMCAVLPMSLLAIPAVPLLIIIALILWLLPDIGKVRVDSAETLILWFLGLNIVWPNYVAFDLPGLPWITPTRIVVFSLLAVIVFGLATSSEFRRRINEVTGSEKSIRTLFWAFWLMTTISLAFSAQLSFSINKYANNQIFWTMMFPVAAYFAVRKGFVDKVATIVVFSLFVVMMLGLYEYKIQKVFWIDQLPFFLRVDPEFLERVAKSQSRAGTDVYRVRGTMATSLYFAEFLAMVFPLALHFMLRSRGFIRTALLAAGVAGTIVVMYLTNARSAMVGLLLTLLIYPLFAAWRRRSLSPRSIGATSTLAMYPFGVIVVALLVVFWRRAHVMVLGGGQHQASSDARNAQWVMGMPKIFKLPLGHGAGTSGEILGYMNGAGELTVDTYYLSVMLDFGLLALPVFVLMFGLPIWFGFKSHTKATTQEATLVAPLAIGLFNFVVIKSVLSSEANMPLAFIMLGCILGLLWRQKQEEAGIAVPGAGAAPANA